MQTYTIDDVPSTASSRRRREAVSHRSGRSHHRPRHRSQYEQDLHSAAPRTEPSYTAPGMVRRHTHHDVSVRESRPRTSRSKSEAYVDMDLAYGDFHPSPPAKPRRPQEIQDNELRNLVSRTERLLDEANCLQHTATATISHLQKNPEAMAAVALTLAEISNLARKLAPTALAALRTSAPAVWALLASPQFLIAAGVGLGVTVVAFGGYKIIKRIQSSKDEQGVNPRGEDMVELNTACLSHVEQWRRGVADAEAESVGTSVEGEFITPTAAAMSRLELNSAGTSRHRRPKSWAGESMGSSRRSRRSRVHPSSRGSLAMNAKSEPRVVDPKAGESVGPRRSTSNAFSRASKPPSKADSRSSGKEKSKSKEKKTGPSRLRQMFRPS